MLLNGKRANTEEFSNSNLLRKSSQIKFYDKRNEGTQHRMICVSLSIMHESIQAVLIEHKRLNTN